MSKKKKEEKQKATTRKLIGIKEIADYSIITYDHGELVYFLIKPSNISVLSEESITARVHALMIVLQGTAEIEMCAYNSRENFDDNKRYLKKRIKNEDNGILSQLLEMDMNHLDEIQIETATSREFAIVIRLGNNTKKDTMLLFPLLLLLIRRNTNPINLVELIKRNKPFYYLLICLFFL